MRDGLKMNEQGKIELLNLETEFCNFSVFWSDFHVLLSVFEFVFVSGRELPGARLLLCFGVGGIKLFRSRRQTSCLGQPHDTDFVKRKIH